MIGKGQRKSIAVAVVDRMVIHVPKIVEFLWVLFFATDSQIFTEKTQKNL